MSQEYQLQAHGEDAMVALGMRFGQVLSATAPGVTVFLQGDLGMGKTTFTRGIMRHFGHQGATKSPTYTLVEPYQFKQQKVHHFDLYRLGHPEELEYLGIRDYFDGCAINLIEWPDKGRDFLPTADVVLTIHPLERGRKLTFVAQTNMGDGVLVHLGKVKQ
ncbi:tRNA (adenosine(37)-N6)-threonylcarbamoyltransferase complex ATPase subunit type 1 TsaE [Oceanospirillaceae bacterium]|nr:tRNA (adenosine(37)-N6)-threonylcarbamoyltransferase complex ATPase subunit type 1 TsaE [Oceanospirillaceae bacterium]